MKNSGKDILSTTFSMLLQILILLCKFCYDILLQI